MAVARVATFENGNDAMMREAMESRGGADMQMPDGLTSSLLLTQDGGKKRLFIAIFDSQGSLDAAAPMFEQMGDEISEDARGKRTSVEVFDVVDQR
ncbi:MAG: hypothetical protein ACYDA3_11980 [Gaiellaceae bacterium]